MLHWTILRAGRFAWSHSFSDTSSPTRASRQITSTSCSPGFRSLYKEREKKTKTKRKCNSHTLLAIDPHRLCVYTHTFISYTQGIVVIQTTWATTTTTIAKFFCWIDSQGDTERPSSTRAEETKLLFRLVCVCVSLLPSRKCRGRERCLFSSLYTSRASHHHPGAGAWCYWH